MNMKHILQKKPWVKCALFLLNKKVDSCRERKKMNIYASPRLEVCNHLSARINKYEEQ